MVFSSITFLVFFLPALLFLYFLSNKIKFRNILLLIFSLLFYSWGEPKYIMLMLISIVINYFTGILITKRPSYKKFTLTAGILINLSFLYFFKYLGFTGYFINLFTDYFNLDPINFKLYALPIGISFYTFQSISYIVDVYRKRTESQYSIFRLGLYISFFPQLIAGPIVRYHDIQEQITKRNHSIDDFLYGLQRFIIGLSKKVLIANVVGEVASEIFAQSYSDVNTFYMWVGILAFSLQLYYDFSGYSDMAIGLARIFGFKLLENFNYPYYSRSVTEFWRRWHISLSNWFRDYVYIPLGGNRKGTIRTIINLYTVFFITGLWHGAAFNFVFWGLGHGILISLEKVLKHYFTIKTNLIIKIIQRIYLLLSFNLLIIFFVYPTKVGFNNLLKLFGYYTSEINYNPVLDIYFDTKFIIIFIIGIIFAFPWWQYKSVQKFFDGFEDKKKFIIKWSLLILLYILSFAEVGVDVYNPFIYFRF